MGDKDHRLLLRLKGHWRLSANRRKPADRPGADPSWEHSEGTEMHPCVGWFQTFWSPEQ